MSEWRYIATRLNGDGTETVLDYELPLSGVQIHNSLNGHGGLDATVAPEIARLKGEDGLPIFTPWSTAVYAEASGQIRGGGIVEANPTDGPDLQLTCIGHTGYLAAQPYMGAKKYVQGDPLQVDREIWTYYQSTKPFNLGVQLTGATESQTVMLAEERDDKPPDPYWLSWWETHDCDREREQLVALGGYEWRITHKWDGETIRHELEYAYPKHGKRRHDLRFVVGENVIADIPTKETADEYASHVLVLGSGEGRKIINARVDRNTGRLGRWVVESDRTLTKTNAAKAVAQSTLDSLTGGIDVTDVDIIDHPNARLGTYAPGDEILIQSGPGWGDFGDLWVRILDIFHSPDDGTTSLKVRRTEKVQPSSPAPDSLWGRVELEPY